MFKTSSRMGSGTFSMRYAFLAFKSTERMCWQSIEPVVKVRSFKLTLSGKSLLVLVIGQTRAKLLSLLKKLLLTTSAGLVPLCSKPFLGLKSILIISPCFARYIKNAPLPLLHPYQILSCWRSEEHTSELQSRFDLVCRLLLCCTPRSQLFPYTTLFRSKQEPNY